jgi:cytochrome d ubiquinol oxidase subunit II
MIDLAVIWAGILAFAVYAYVVLDGFDLGIGILAPFARPPSRSRTRCSSLLSTRRLSPCCWR